MDFELTDEDLDLLSNVDLINQKTITFSCGLTIRIEALRHYLMSDKKLLRLD